MRSERDIGNLLNQHYFSGEAFQSCAKNPTPAIRQERTPDKVLLVSASCRCQASHSIHSPRCRCHPSTDCFGNLSKVLVLRADDRLDPARLSEVTRSGTAVPCMWQSC